MTEPIPPTESGNSAPRALGVPPPLHRGHSNGHDLPSPTAEAPLEVYLEDKDGAAGLHPTHSRQALHSSHRHPHHKHNSQDLGNSQSTLAESHQEYRSSFDLGLKSQPSNSTFRDKILRRKRNDSMMTATTIGPYAEHGALIDRSRTAEMKKPAGAALAWPRIRRVFRDAFSEYLGTFILVMFGDGVVAQVLLSNGEKGSYQSISWGWVSSFQI
jgi:hypothetical protein